jgi:hypothetical protein
MSDALSDALPRKILCCRHNSNLNPVLPLSLEPAVNAAIAKLVSSNQLCIQQYLRWNY